MGGTWHTARERSGRVRFWIEPQHRRSGFATAVLRALEEEAREWGTDRSGPSVWTDNPEALALYSKLGYVTASMRVIRSLDGAAPP